MTELFTDAIDYRSYRLIENSVWYDDDVVSDLNKMPKETAVQMKDRMFNRKDPLSIVTFRQDFKAACNACNIYEGVVMWLFK